MIRIQVLSAVVLVSMFALAGCVQPATPPTAAALVASTQPTDAAAGIASAEGKPVAATVNGRPILMEQLNEQMLINHGVEAAEQLIATSVVQQEAAKEGVTVAQADIDAENAETLNQMAANLSPAEQQRVLDQLMESKGVTRQQWDATMQRNAVLRKLATKRLKITEPMLTDEFNRLYGAKRQVRHIACASMVDAQAMLDRINKGEDFATLATKYSTNTRTAPQGGLVPPFSQNTETVPTEFRNTAFAMKLGEVSSVVGVDKEFHILKLEKIIPPDNVTLESVRASLLEQLTATQTRMMQSQILDGLMRSADVQFVNPTLKEQTRAKAEAGIKR